MIHAQLDPPEIDPIALPALAAIFGEDRLVQPGECTGQDDDEDDEDDAETVAHLNLQPATVAYLDRVSRLLQGRPGDRAAVDSLTRHYLAAMGIKPPSVTSSHAAPGADNQALGPLERNEHP